MQARKTLVVPALDSAFTTPLCKLRIENRRTWVEGSNGKPYNFSRHRGKWWGILIHTTGCGPEELAKKRGWTTDETAIWTYAQDWMNCSHYLLLSNGIFVQITSEDFIAPHCGVKPWQYARFKDGTWKDFIPETMLAQWKAAWPGVKSPADLYPNAGSANPDVLGVECVPQPNGTFTDLQYAALHAFVLEVSVHHEMGITAGRHRLLGHEDVNPYFTKDNGRADNKGGWDPGARRPNPKFHWDRVLLTPK
ncbi:MAG: N-acetylmuramoyl-L-alanine amidase [Candidatus Paceibacterota bacterium]|jgi:hypothetical protein